MRGDSKYDDQMVKKTKFWADQKDYEMLGIYTWDIAGVDDNNYQTKIRKFLSEHGVTIRKLSDQEITTEVNAKITETFLRSQLRLT